MRYEKGSFLIVPNKIYLQGLEPFIQTTYFWICHFADERGRCYPSRTTLSKFAGCSVKSIDRAIEQLCRDGLLKKDIRKSGEKNLTNLYNIEILPDGSVPQSLPSDSQSLGVATDSPTELYPVLTQSSRAEPRVVISYSKEEDTERAQTKPPKYPHAQEVFSWFPRPQKSWMALKDVREREAAEFLWERGEMVVKKALKYIEGQKENGDFRYVVVKPSQLESKWMDISEYARRT